jgi:hypothetical protein
MPSPTPRDDAATWRRRPAALAAALLVSACATSPPPPTQAIEVRVQAEDVTLDGPLQCEARNDLGHWPFAAPGTVSVRVSKAPLQLTCRPPAHLFAQAERAAATSPSREGARSGAKVGAGVGVAVGAAAVPVFGPGVAVLMVVGSALRGAEIGGTLGALSHPGGLAYPSPIVVHVKRVALAD